MRSIAGRQAPGYDDGSRWHPPVRDFTAVPIVYARTLADKYAHGNNGSLFNDHAFDNFRSCANKAVIFDDRRPGLHRFEHTTDAGAAGQVHILADLRAGTDSCLGVDESAAVYIRANIDVAGHQYNI